VSTVRLVLLLQLQQQVQLLAAKVQEAVAQAQVAATAAVEAVAAATGLPALQALRAAAVRTGADPVAPSQRRSTPAAPPAVNIDLTCAKVALLCCADEAEQGGSMLSMHSIPLFEAAVLPLQVQLHLQPASAAHSSTPQLMVAGAGSPMVKGGQTVKLLVKGVAQVDAFSVDKLGWEGVLDPWGVQVRLGRWPRGGEGDDGYGLLVSRVDCHDRVVVMLCWPRQEIACGCVEGMHHFVLFVCPPVARCRHHPCCMVQPICCKAALCQQAPKHAMVCNMCSC
jgi:hypothetical protein